MSTYCAAIPYGSHSQSIGNASDYIAKRRFESQCNVMKTRAASSVTTKNEVNAVRCVSSTTPFGTPSPTSWFDVVIPASELTRHFPQATIQSTSTTTPTTPIMYAHGPLETPYNELLWDAKKANTYKAVTCCPPVRTSPH